MITNYKKHDKLLEAQEVIDKTKQLQEDSVRELTRKLKSIDKSISNIDELEDERDTINEALTGIKTFAMIVPVGGFSFIGGWVCLSIFYLKK